MLNIGRREHAFRDVGCTAVTFLASLSSLLLLQQGGPARDRQIDADSAGFILLVRDLITGSGGLSDWYLGTHHYLFPDGLLACIALGMNVLGVPIFDATVGLFGVCYFVVLAYVWHVSFGNRFKKALCWSAIAVTFAFVISYSRLGDWFEAEMMAKTLVPSTHQGAILTSLIAVAIVQKLMSLGSRSSERKTFLAILVVLVVLGTFSDILFVPWAICPLIAVTLSRWRSVPRGSNMTIVGVIILAAIFGYAASKLIGYGVLDTYLAKARVDVSVSMAAALGFLSDGARFNTLAAGVLVYTNGILWIACLILGLRSPRGQSAALASIVIFCGTATFTSIFAATVVGMFKGAVTMRYILPYVFYGYLALAAYLVFEVMRWFGRTSLLVPPVLSCAMCLAVLGALMPAPRSTADRIADCLDTHQLTLGAAHYWDANPIMLANSKVRLVPLYPEGPEPYAWNTKRAWMTLKPMQFVVSEERLSEKDIEAFGEPSRTIPCGGRLIFDLRG